MPRGTETENKPEVPQEGGEPSREVEEKNQESQRTTDIVNEPEAVVEREQKVEVSEDIEKELVAAVEAVEAVRDGGQKTEDQEGQMASGEVISATPIPLPMDPTDRSGDEISATPIPLPGENLENPESEISATPIPLPGENLEDPESKISATPIPLPGENLEDPESKISATPIPLPGENLEGPESEISATPINTPGPKAEGDGGPKTEDREGQAAGTEQVSATPIPLPTDPPTIREEISATPIPLPGENQEGPEDRISATPIPLPGENQEGPEDRISATPIPLPRPSGETQVNEISATPIPLPRPSGETQVNEISATPIPLPGGNQEGPEDRISATPIPLPRPSDETQVDEISAMPIPLPRPSDETQVDEISAMPIPLPRPSDKTQGDEISATPINSPGQNDEVELIPENDRISLVSDKNRAAETAPSPEIQKEPPPPPPPPDLAAEQLMAAEEPNLEMAQVEEILLESPPGEIAYELEGEGGEELTSFSEEMDGEGPVETMVPAGEGIPELEEYWKPPEMYTLKNPDGTITFVDRKGTPIDCPPHYLVNSKDNSVQAWYHDTDQGKSFRVKQFPGHSSNYILAYQEPDGSVTLVDKNGYPISSPPAVTIENGRAYATAYDGGVSRLVSITFYEPPTDGVFAYTHPDGSIDIVDKDGSLVYSPPHYYRDGTTGQVYLNSSEGKPLEIPDYLPPLENIYVYTAQDGSFMVVDKEGNPVKSPPHAFRWGEDDICVNGPDDKPIKIPVYQSLLQDIYVYTAQDGTKTIVDKTGNPVKSPPPLWNDPSNDGNAGTTIGPGGEKVVLEAYTPPTTGIFVHTAMDGTKTVVDENGVSLKSPPPVWNDLSGDGAITVGAAGEKIKLQEYKPISSHWKK